MAAQPDPDDLGRDDYQATYCPEDNKLRLYTGRVERSTYEWLRELGFTSTPKQSCTFVATWTPEREDAALAMIAEGDDIGDEDQSPEERAADRAERFAGYLEKRRGEAHALADNFDQAPAAFGNQNHQVAQRQAARRDRTGARAVSQWSKAEYWSQRTQGVIAHALHRSDAATRRGRILRLEAEQRKNAASIAEAQRRFDLWAKVLTLDGADDTIKVEDGSITATSPAPVLAYRLAGESYIERPHPRTGRVASILSHLVDRAKTGDPITAREAVEMAIGGQQRPMPGRWAEHYERRLAYERQMLENEGGSAGNVEMIPGGCLGRYLITKVNKSPETGAVVSVNVYAPDPDGRCDHRRRGDDLLLNVQRMAEHVYAPPTPDTLAQLEAIKAERLARTQARNAKAPKLINPTRDAAERLQEALNRTAYEARRAREIKNYGRADEYRPTPVCYMTQAEYSERSAGTYGTHKTAVLHFGPELHLGGYRAPEGATVCKVRVGPRGQITSPAGVPGMVYVTGYTEAPAVVCITDKPQQDLPQWQHEAAQEVSA